MALAIVALLGVASCTKATGVKESEAVPPSPEEQQLLAEESFYNLLEVTQRMGRTEKNDILLDGYRSIIANYPDSSLAYESYYHMIRHLLYNYDIPREAEAESAYREYMKKNKNGLMEAQISFEIARYYYDYKRWKKLISFTVPVMRKYVNTGKIKDQIYAFYYSEARYHLKEYDEAIRGYVTYLRLQPDGGLTKYVNKRLRELKHLKEQSK